MKANRRYRRDLRSLDRKSIIDGCVLRHIVRSLLRGDEASLAGNSFCMLVHSCTVDGGSDDVNNIELIDDRVAFDTFYV